MYVLTESLTLSLKHTGTWTPVNYLPFQKSFRDYKSWLDSCFSTVFISMSIFLCTSLGCMIAYKVMMVRALSLSLSLILRSRISNNQTQVQTGSSPRLYGQKHILDSIDQWTDTSLDFTKSTMTLRVIDTWCKTKTCGLISCLDGSEDTLSSRGGNAVHRDTLLRISINLVTFGVLMLFVTGANYFLPFRYGDGLESSPELLALSMHFGLIGSYDFHAMNRVVESTYFVAIYILFFLYRCTIFPFQ